MHTVILTELGIIVYEDERVKDTLPFRDASEYVAVKKGEGGISGLWEHLAGANTAVTVNDAMLHAVLKRKSVDVQMMNEEESDRIQSQKPQVLIESGLAKDQDDARAKLREFAMQLSSSKVTEASESPDLHIIQAIGALDDVDRMANALGSRLREWYGLHFPELENISGQYCRLFADSRGGQKGRALGQGIRGCRISGVQGRDVITYTGKEPRGRYYK